jgi:hypothetical protein
VCVKFGTTERLDIRKKCNPAITSAISRLSSTPGGSVSANSSASHDIRKFTVTSQPFPRPVALEMEVCTVNT